MYKILALNCLITAYSLSVQYLDGIKFGDYQVTVTGMLMSVCFLCISRAKVRIGRHYFLHVSSYLTLQPVEKLSRERPLSNIFNFYVLLSVLLQFALHIISMVYITELAHGLEEYVTELPLHRDWYDADVLTSRGPIDLEAKFEANLLNTAVFLLGLSQQVSTFAINFQVRHAAKLICFSSTP
jgi:cation-transporting ATPase 13A1